MPFIATIIAAMSLGAMVFFSAAVAPVTFAALPADQAGKFLRAVFPRYFLLNGLAALAAGALALRQIETPLLWACGALMVAVWFWMIPVINTARDQMLAGDMKAKARFAFWHRGSVILNLVEMVGLCVAIVLLAR